jgi:copper(I)-binding protein
MHGTDIVDGVARMREHETVTVPAGEAVSFEPGGLHLMLMQAVDGIPSSGTINMALLLEGGERLEFVAPVGQPGN